MLFKTTVQIFKYLSAYLILSVGTLLMLRTIIEYTSFDSTVGFLKVKQEYLAISFWKVAFYTHVFSSVFTLLAGFTQFTSLILKDYPRVHRVVGKMYVSNILLINFPAALIMAIYANGLLPSKIAFIILDCLWFWFTYKAWIEISRGHVEAHRKFMIRSYALTCSALTLRSWKLILSYYLQLDPLLLYMIDAWMGFVPNLLFAEWWIWTKGKHAATVRIGN
jgi:uncharacterized membrane protein